MRGFVRSKKTANKIGFNLAFALVESTRDKNGQVRQKYICYLGSLKIVGDLVSCRSKHRFREKVSEKLRVLKINPLSRDWKIIRQDIQKALTNHEIYQYVYF